MEKPAVTVSAIITTHNRSSLLRRAIESATSQTIASKEVIVVDDASTDDTQAVANAFPSVKYIRIDASESKGGNHARNVGIAASCGKFVAFLDDDDYWQPNKLELQVAEAERSGAGVVYCMMTHERIEADGTVRVEESYCSRPNAYWQPDMSRNIFCAIPTVTSCVLFKRDPLLAVGCFDESLTSWQEYELLIRLAQQTRFSIVDRCLVVYRLNPHDKHRVSNRYFEWRTSVKRIEAKHDALINKLPVRYRLRWEIVKLTDATGRAKDAGMPVRSILISIANLALRTICKALMIIQGR